MLKIRTKSSKKRKVNLRKIFGSHKFSKPIEQLMKEIDKELYRC